MSYIEEVLKKDKRIISDNLRILENFMCIEKDYKKDYELFKINPEIGLLVKKLVLDNPSKIEYIKSLIRESNNQHEIQATSNETEILGVFNSYCKNNDFLQAKKFILESIDTNKESIILKYNAAYFLYEKSDDMQKSIKLLKEIIDQSDSFFEDAYSLIVKCSLKLNFPDFPEIELYVKEMIKYASKPENIILISQFYIDWSNVVKMKSRELDVLKEYDRRRSYKELAQKALNSLTKISTDYQNNHRILYLKSNSYFNLWENEKANNYIDRAIDLIKKSNEGINHLNLYKRFKATIKNRM